MDMGFHRRYETSREEPNKLGLCAGIFILVLVILALIYGIDSDMKFNKLRLENRERCLKICAPHGVFSSGNDSCSCDLTKEVRGM